ncbi:MAG: 4-hydroxythreonine-4-phosphate dehydrogenase PdxA [Steroidobacteraceae bacterium]|jgi:4-hydroxythreonine-4-phosphate dehydrogenase|nr:4-hydroxythreonine-4-phosphate dehydrogenase PdxA [Steroidobacteraceae bacterium]
MSKRRSDHAAAAPLPRLVLTSGEPAGIGPELCAQVAAARDFDAELVCLGDPRLLADRARDAGVAVRIERFDPAASPSPHQRGRLCVWPVPLAAPAQAGRLDVANAPHVVTQVDTALDQVLANRFDALVTAPVQKSVINEAGVPFTGHTEHLAARSGAPRPVMLLVAGRMRVALATTHLALRAVAAAVTPQLLGETLRIVDDGLRTLWGFARPRIAVCGLNPHAGESGHLGDEELRVIAPAIAAARAAGIDAAGPLPADTVFVPRELARYDVVLAMYHDQGLPVLKHAGFGHAVNVTLGLPVLRTSVDHGTALDLAGSGRADPGSLEAAIELALELVGRRRAG